MRHLLFAEEVEEGDDGLFDCGGAHLSLERNANKSKTSLSETPLMVLKYTNCQGRDPLKSLGKHENN